MRLGIMADIHGNDVALRAVLDDSASCRVDRWWILGDLVLLGPLVEMLRGNTDRYVLTGGKRQQYAHPSA
jgi:predicted phosphodiesterase